MTRQHSTPLLLQPGSPGAVPLVPLSLKGVGDAVSEADIQALVQAHPECLPIAEIDPLFINPVPVCTESATAGGSIDNFMVTPSGLPIIVECKLWRNPEGRREVVGQILDYAKELSRWSSSDLQREVRRRLRRDGDPILELVRAQRPEVDEAQFNDAVTSNLRRGRFLLLIVGDGIREGVEAIAEYLKVHAGLHFSLGLVEMPIYGLPGGARLVAPRVLARTTVITRTVVAMPEGFALRDGQGQMLDSEEAHEPVGGTGEQPSRGQEQQIFWNEFLGQLTLDDPEQSRPKPARIGYLIFPLPARSGSSWLTVYRDASRGEVGVFLSSSRNSSGEYAMQSIADDWQNVKAELGGTARLVEKDGRPRIIDSMAAERLDDLEVRRDVFSWLAERVNTFVNVMRPRVRSAAADYESNNK